MLNKLGKQLLILLMSLPLYASVKVIAPDYFMEGEAFEFKIIAKGFEIQIPQIKEIDAYLVENTQSSQEAVLVETRQATKQTNTYRVFAKKTFTLPSFDIEVDNISEFTKSKIVRLKKVSKTISKDFDFDMKVDKSSAYVGEKIRLTLRFTYNDLEDYSLPQVDFPDFLIKEIDNKDYTRKDGYQVEESTYSLVAQKQGKISLYPLKVEVESLEGGYKKLNNKSKYIKKRSIYSNELTLNVKAIPQGASVFGDYELLSSLDKQRVHIGEAVTLTLSIKGQGNIDNMDGINFSIPNTSIYEKSTATSKIFEIVSDKNFTIPSLSIKYFDKNTHKLKILKSKIFNIEVIDPSSHKATKESSKEEASQKYFYFFIGVLSTLIVLLLLRLVKKTVPSKKKSPLLKVLQQSKNKEDLLKKIVPYLGVDKSLDRLIYRLEDETSEFQKIKKEIIIKSKKLLSTD